jgi:hypothetical protein
MRTISIALPCLAGGSGAKNLNHGLSRSLRILVPRGDMLSRELEMTFAGINIRHDRRSTNEQPNTKRPEGRRRQFVCLPVLLMLQPQRLGAGNIRASAESSTGRGVSGPSQRSVRVLLASVN